MLELPNYTKNINCRYYRQQLTIKCFLIIYPGPSIKQSSRHLLPKPFCVILSTFPQVTICMYSVVAGAKTWCTCVVYVQKLTQQQRRLLEVGT